MPSYMFRDERGDIPRNAHDLAQPIPAHALTPAAEWGRERVRLAYQRDQAMREASRAPQAETEAEVEPLQPWMVTPEMHVRVGGETIRIVTGAPRPGDVVTSGARALERVAAEHGFEVKRLVLPDRVIIEGLHRRARVGFRAGWVEGRASFGSSRPIG